MGIVKGLNNIKKHNEAEEAKFAGRGGEPAKWLKVADKQTVKIRFLQELDANSPNYSQKNDLAFLAVEHSNPKNFMRKALCTNEDDVYTEGVCWACDQHQKDFKAGWGQKTRFYANVLVDDGNNDPYVAIISQGSGDASITPFILALAQDEDNPTITDKWFKLTRKGTGTDTSWTLIPGAPAKENVEDYELHDLEKAVRDVPYAEQEAHYLGGNDQAKAESTPVAEEAAAKPHTEW